MKKIDTVLFDMGGTLEDIFNTHYTLENAAQGIIDILERHSLPFTQPVKEMQRMLLNGLRRYSSLRDEDSIELKPERVWADYMLCESGISSEKVEAIGEELANCWESLYFTRTLRPGAAEMLRGLRSLGLKLGIVSNTASLYQVFDQLDKYGIREYFSNVTLSSQIGYRKPHPNIFQIALRQLSSDAGSSVYVGDTVSRDILGSKRAGFAYSILINSQMTKEKDEAMIQGPQPDFVVGDITEVLQVCRSLAEEEAVE